MPITQERLKKVLGIAKTLQEIYLNDMKALGLLLDDARKGRIGEAEFIRKMTLIVGTPEVVISTQSVQIELEEFKINSTKKENERIKRWRDKKKGRETEEREAPEYSSTPDPGVAEGGEEIMQEIVK